MTYGSKARFRVALGVLAALPLAGCTGGGGPGITQGVAPAAIEAPGASLLADLDPADRQKAEAARQTALDKGASGTAVSWKSDLNGGRFGSVVAGPVFASEGKDCRQFTQTVYVDGVPRTGRASACKQPDGSWRAA